jgi:hypothetical protein
MNLETLFYLAVRKGLYTQAAKLAAVRYIREHFRPANKKHCRSIYSLKHDFERATDHYITEADYRECFLQCGFKVCDNRAYAAEVNDM